MNVGDVAQHYLDSLVLKLTDAAATACSVLITEHSIEFSEPPTLSEVISYTDWCWSVFVKDPLGMLDTKYEPTDLDDVYLHYKMMQRRKHIEILEMSQSFDVLPERKEEPMSETEDILGGQYL